MYDRVRVSYEVIAFPCLSLRVVFAGWPEQTASHMQVLDCAKSECVSSEGGARTSAGVKISEIFAKPEFDPDEVYAYTNYLFLTPLRYI